MVRRGIVNRRRSRIHSLRKDSLANAVFALVLAASFPMNAKADQPIHMDVRPMVYDNTCGPISLQVCEYILIGKLTPFEEVAEMTNLTKTGTDLGNLMTAAERLGLNAVAFDFSRSPSRFLEAVGVDGTVGIIHMKNDHFVVVESARNSKLKIIDYPDAPILLDVERLTSIWSGNVLLISTDPIKLPFLTRRSGTMWGSVLVSLGFFALLFRLRSRVT